MHVSRRQLLLGSACCAALSGCASDLGRYAHTPLAELGELAAASGICHAAYVLLRAGVPGPIQLVRGCDASAEAGPNAVLQAASLTKPVLAFTVLELAQAGNMELQAPVSTYLPKGYAHRQKPFGNPTDNPTDWVAPSTLARMTVANLLNHSAGLPNWTRSALKPAFEPGTRWQYSGEGYLVLQAIVEAVTGQGIEAAVSQRVFEPLGMQDSRMRLTDDIRARVLGGLDGQGRSAGFDFTQANAAASLYTTAGDYARFLAALAARGDLLAATVADPIEVDRKLGLRWGRGWGIEDAEGGPFLWQWGNNPGYRAFAMLSQRTGDGFVLMTNSERGLRLAAPLAHAAAPAQHGVFRFGMLG
jgi:CubicO group peptidase (beta-lactamase class C family)